jgi:hypothetical protein
MLQFHYYVSLSNSLSLPLDFTIMGEILQEDLSIKMFNNYILQIDN